MGMGIDQWEWEGMGILIVFPHTSSRQCLAVTKYNIGLEGTLCMLVSLPSVTVYLSAIIFCTNSFTNN